MPRSKSSSAWLARHVRDPYVKRANKEGARSRARFKLAEIDARDKLLRPGMTVLDLGAAPGGWSEYAATRVAPRGRVVAVDVLPIAPIAGVEILRGNIADPEVLDFLKSTLAGAADLVISDMAPSMTGIASRDQALSAALAELAVDISEKTLRRGGVLVLKAFHGVGFDELIGRLRRRFDEVATRKPSASRAESREIYLLAKGFKG
ncbi:MAG TPA: RlmE family RNA methyltransferase [Burkholderiales bacterium]